MAATDSVKKSLQMIEWIDQTASLRKATTATTTT